MESPTIGTVLNYKDKTIKVLAKDIPSCEGCLFNDSKMGFKHFSCRNLKWGCTPYQRKDKRHIIFKYISNNTIKIK